MTMDNTTCLEKYHWTSSFRDICMGFPCWTWPWLDQTLLANSRPCYISHGQQENMSDQLHEGKVRKSEIASATVPRDANSNSVSSSAAFHHVSPATTHEFQSISQTNRTNPFSWGVNTNFGLEPWQKHQPRLLGYSFRGKAALHFLILHCQTKWSEWVGFSHFNSRFASIRTAVGNTQQF